MLEDMITWCVEGAGFTGGLEPFVRIKRDSRSVPISHVELDPRKTSRGGELYQGVDQVGAHARTPDFGGDPHRNEPTRFLALRIGAESNDAHVFSVDHCDECREGGDLLCPALERASSSLADCGGKRIWSVVKRSQTNAPQALFFSGAQRFDSHDSSIVEAWAGSADWLFSSYF